MAADPSPVAPSTVSTAHFVKDKHPGIDQTYDGDQFYVGGGVASFDCDGDGRPDLYVAGGDNPAGLFHNESAVGGALRFSRLTDPVTDLTVALEVNYFRLAKDRYFVPVSVKITASARPTAARYAG